jgi:hypothetical protein
MCVRQYRNWSSGRAMAALVLSAGLAAAGCGSNTSEQSAADEHAGHAMARVFFVQPTDGATVRSPVHFEFGSEQFAIAPVPQGEIQPQDVRPGIGHFHLGVNTDCLPDGQVIVQAEPWIHFGTGANTIEMELAPGTYRFVVQAGDDLHRTFGGCESITVTVVE